MPLDGALSDRLSGEPIPRRIRPVTLEYASAHFPRMIVRMKQGRLHVSTARAAHDKEVVRLWNKDPTLKNEHWFILMSDFGIVKEIAADTAIWNPYESIRQVEERIRARVEVEFAGRGVPT